MGETGLDATDALHVATAIVAEVRDIATGDADYSRIPFPRIHLIRDE
jgi:predicted nucleic acid-binding protein